MSRAIATVKSLSVIIPAYNEEASIVACIQALLRQTRLPDEILVVDNNSSDATVRLVKQFPTVKLIREHRQGLYFARNRGMDEARGDVLARIDADTIVDPQWAECLLTSFQTNAAKAVSGPVGYYDMPLPRLVRAGEDACLRFAHATGYHFLMGANMAVRKDVWISVRDLLCNEKFLFEDIDISLHLQSQGTIPMYVPDMKAMVSARRLQDKPADFMRYIAGHTRTWRHHGLRPSFGTHFAQATFAATYIMIKPLHMVFDPVSRTIDMSRLTRRTAARPDPMAVEA